MNLEKIINDNLCIKFGIIYNNFRRCLGRALMKNLVIGIRNKFNKKIDDDVKKEIENLKFCDVSDFYIDEDYLNSFEEKYSRVKYILGFCEDDIKILENLELYVQKLDLENLCKMCDEYEFRFFKIFGYIIGTSLINRENFKDVYSLFCNLIKKGETLNSINLSLFVIGIFDKRSVHNLCRKILHKYIDHVEICGFICRNDYFESQNLYFNLVRDSYKDFNLEFLFKINKFEKLNSRALILCFYLFGIDNLNFKNFDIPSLKILIEYIINLRKSVCRVSNSFLFENKMEEFKNLSRDLNSFVGNIKEILRKKSIAKGNKDIGFISLCIYLFEDIREMEIDEKLLNFLFENLVSFIKDRDFKSSLQIMKIYDKLEVNVSSRLAPLFFENYSSAEFGIYILRLFRGYKYFGELINEFEKGCYLTKLMDEFEFRKVLLRSLSVFYSKNSNLIAGVNFLKIFMDKFEFYVEGIGYINFVAQKILERSCD